PLSNCIICALTISLIRAAVVVTESVCLALFSSEKWMGKCFRLGTGVINGNQRFCDSSDSVKDVNIYRQHPKKPHENKPDKY
uniref:Chemokine interleukin-8-like domain-containing protein n=1 Tax=Amphiprion ocellaris TaxID=80972 RepID=A0AAQ5XNA2_AMPOC